MKTICVIAPHPDDETLGCGGTLLRHQAEGDEIHWCIVTRMTKSVGFTSQEMERRDQEISTVANYYKFSSVHDFGYPTTKLDIIPIGEIIEKFSNIFQTLGPEIVYLPYFADVHSDHRVVFNAAVSSSKWFRCRSIKRLLAYETLSETGFGMSHPQGFGPNVYIDIAPFLDRKIKIMKIYRDQLKDFPFPRSEPAIRALASLRGTAAGCEAAEAFMLLKEIL
jgi:LmbE family N-acetylglucosaminyl deacetylase